MPQLSDFLGSGVSSGNFPLAFSSAIAADAVSQGDALAMLADGTVTYALPVSDPNSALRPLAQVGDLANTVTKNTVVSTGTASSPVKLSSGNLAVPVIVPTTSFPQVFVYAPSGALLFSATIESASASTFKIAALIGGGFVAVYKTASGLRYGVYDNTGAVVTAPVTQTVNATSVLSVTALSNGGFSLLWVFNSSGFTVSTAAFNATGVQQGTTTAIETVAAAESFAAGNFPAAMAPYGSTGGYCVTYNYTTASQTTFNIRVAFFNSSATLQNGLINITTNVGQSSVLKLATLTDGSIVLAYTSPNTSAKNGYVKYNAAGVQAVAPTQIDGGSIINSLALVAMVSSTFGLFYNISGSDLVQKLFDGTGAIIGAATTYSSAFGAGGTYTNIDIQQIGDGSWLAAAVSSSAAATPRAVRINSALNATIATALVLDTVNGSTTGFVLVVIPTTNPVTASTTAMVAYIGATPDVRIANFVTAVKARSFVGVATAAAAASSPVKMQIIGPAQISRAFAPSVAVNFQANAIPGQKASLVGTTAILNGIQ